MSVEQAERETVEPTEEAQVANAGVFALDIDLIEFGDETDVLIEMTNNGCGSTCPKACASGTGM